jgi:hypothetical protein
VNMTRWLMVAALGMLGSGWIKADTTDVDVPGHYVIVLTDWDPNQNFDFLPNVPPPDDLEPNPCYPTGDICGDPSIGLERGGKSASESGDYTFNSGPTGSAAIDIENTGPPITSLEITTNLTPDETNALFICYSDIFQNCAFVNDSFDIYFWNPYVTGGIATAATPEPAQWFIPLFAFAAVIVARSRKASANSSCAQTQR